jgi:hypothetical protein
MVLTPLMQSAFPASHLGSRNFRNPNPFELEHWEAWGFVFESLCSSRHSAIFSSDFAVSKAWTIVEKLSVSITEKKNKTKPRRAGDRQ